MPSTWKKPKPAPFKSKKTVLNLVYFLDAKKTRSLKIPMPVAKGIFAFLSLGVIWGSFLDIYSGLFEFKGNQFARGSCRV